MSRPGLASPWLSSLGLTEYSAEALYNTAGYWPRSNAGGVFANEKYCTIGGYQWGAAGINVQEYDPVGDAWTEMGEDMLPGAASGQFSAAVLGTDIYLLGGVGASTQILKYDTVANTLTDTGDTLLKGVLRSAAVAWGGKIIVLGGEGANGGNTAALQVYDPVTVTVKYGRNLPIGMSRLAAAIDGSTIYLGGTYEATDPIADYSGNDLWSCQASWVVPEPGTMALFGFGLLGLRRRK